MATEATIIKQIEKTAAGKYSDWLIGLTDDPAVRKAQLDNPLSFLQWKADTERAAKNVERYFLAKGMHSAGAAPQSALHVYILLAINPGNTSSGKFSAHF